MKNFLTRVTLILSMIFLVTPNHLEANPQLKGLDPRDCEPSHCICFTPPALKKIAGGIKSLALCEENLQLAESLTMKERVVVPDEKKWSFTPSVVVGSVSISLGIVGLVGYSLGLLR